MAICFILNWSYDKTIDDLVFRLKSIELSLFGIMIKMGKLIELMKKVGGGGGGGKWRFKKRRKK